MLTWRPHLYKCSLSFQLSSHPVGGQSGFSIGDELLHRSMDGHPNAIQGCQQFLFLLGLDDSSCMPAGSTTNQMGNDMFRIKHQICFNMFIEGGGHPQCWNGFMCRSSPLPARDWLILACRHNTTRTEDSFFRSAIPVGSWNLYIRAPTYGHRLSIPTLMMDTLSKHKSWNAPPAQWCGCRNDVWVGKNVSRHDNKSYDSDKLP